MKRSLAAAALLLFASASLLALHPRHAMADDVEDLLHNVPSATPTPTPGPQGDQRTFSPNRQLASIREPGDIPGQPGPTFPPPPDQVPQLAQLITVPEPLIPHLVPQQRDDCPVPNLECVPPPRKDNPATLCRFRLSVTQNSDQARGPSFEDQVRAQWFWCHAQGL